MYKIAPTGGEKRALSLLVNCDKNKTVVVLAPSYAPTDDLKADIRKFVKTRLAGHGIRGSLRLWRRYQRRGAARSSGGCFGQRNSGFRSGMSRRLSRAIPERTLP